jgi:hypothetical protein
VPAGEVTYAVRMGSHRRSSLLLVALASLAGLAATNVPGGLAKAAAKHSGGLVFQSFKLKGTNGYTVEAIEVREADFPPTAAVAAHLGSLSADYEVPGDLRPGMHAVFGSLGSVAVEFQRQKRSVDKLEKGCTSITEKGVFRGRFSFVGEGAYTAVEATSAAGQVLRLPNGFCGFDDRRGVGPPGLPRLTRLEARSAIAQGPVEFVASRLDGGGRVDFDASLREDAGPMRILRSASAIGAEGSFVHGRGQRPRSAAVSPPAPFQGSARFLDPVDGPPTWIGTLSVSLPGAPSISLSGPSFAARLCAHTTLFAACKVALPEQTG